jgi:hypothetical protein
LKSRAKERESEGDRGERKEREREAVVVVDAGRCLSSSSLPLEPPSRRAGASAPLHEWENGRVRELREGESLTWATRRSHGAEARRSERGGARGRRFCVFVRAGFFFSSTSLQVVSDLALLFFFLLLFLPLLRSTSRDSAEPAVILAGRRDPQYLLRQELGRAPLSRKEEGRRTEKEERRKEKEEKRSKRRRRRRCHQASISRPSSYSHSSSALSSRSQRWQQTQRSSLSRRWQEAEEREGER